MRGLHADVDVEGHTCWLVEHPGCHGTPGDPGSKSRVRPAAGLAMDQYALGHETPSQEPGALVLGAVHAA